MITTPPELQSMADKLASDLHSRCIGALAGVWSTNLSTRTIEFETVVIEGEVYSWDDMLDPLYGQLAQQWGSIEGVVQVDVEVRLAFGVNCNLGWAQMAIGLA